MVIFCCVDHSTVVRVDVTKELNIRLMSVGSDCADEIFDEQLQLGKIKKIKSLMTYNYSSLIAKQYNYYERSHHLQ